jgi:EAL domain-containing protein (putative c-di-GMP-specific phosphodiesterase class I)/ActR/RegA family two-component response regulator
VRLGDLDRLLRRAASQQPLQDQAKGVAAANAEIWPDARVLVVDDGEVNREVALEALSRFGVQADTAENGEAALERMARQRFDLVLMDGAMPVLDGFTATQQWRAFEAGEGRERVPIVALTAHVVGRAADAWREAGMDGVLHKPFTLHDLGRILRDWLPESLRREGLDLAPVSEADDAAGDDLFDHKTFGALIAGLDKGRGDFVRRVVGLYSDRAPEALDALRAAHRRHDAEGVAGAAHALKSMSLNLGASAVAEVAAGLERAIRIESRRVTIDEITLLEARLEKTLAALDARLGVSALTPSPALADNTEADMMSALSAALDANQLEMWYQPIFDRAGARIISAEALIRWNRGGLPAIGPGVFMPLAEKYDSASGGDLVCRIGAFARRRVLEDALNWPEITIAVNVSANELGQSDFTAQVAKTLAETGFDAKRLVLEVTETAFLGEPERIRELFAELHALGLKLALDDFGVGYSSLTALHRFSFDKIKIDREFVVALDGERQSALEALAIIQAVTGIGRVFGMTVVAEGVESPSQHTHLKACGVHQIQGYLFGKPMPAKAFSALLAQSQAAAS